MAMELHEAAAPVRPARGWIWRIFAVLGGAAGICWTLSLGLESGHSRSSVIGEAATVQVDQGDVVRVVTERGSIESSDDSVVRCQVESFLGLPGGALSANPITQLAQSTSGRSTRAPAVPAPAAQSGTKGAAPVSKAQIKSIVKAGEGGLRTEKPAARAAVAFAPSELGGRSMGTAATSSPALVPDSSVSLTRPEIRSFRYVVEPYTPLRANLPDQGTTATARPAPPKIISIRAEGSAVKSGEAVCQLDSSVFRDALPVQQIRYVQAKACVQQAQAILEANEIACREYSEGIFPQDVEQVKDYISICEAERDRARRNLTWSRAVALKGYRTLPQVHADAAALKQAEFTLHDARCMLNRLVKYTGPRIEKALKAKVQAIHADLLALESCLSLEGDRLKRIEAMIANCTMRAPRDGIVVYANRSNAWGTVVTQIREGLQVYQSQPVFRLLDPQRMHVLARINESQVAQVRSGQPVMIHLEAFPDQPLSGSVAEIIPIASLANGPYSDVRTYSATINIDSGGFDELRSGMTAEVDFLVESRHKVTRVPLEAIRWADDKSYVAMATDSPDGLDWIWKRIDVGVTDTSFSEVVAGLEPGDRVIAQCESLPEPGPPASEAAMDLAMEEPDGSDSIAVRRE
jgi:multidrug resistance efflux pump